jgi:hypothetical protein
VDTHPAEDLCHRDPEGIISPPDTRRLTALTILANKRKKFYSRIPERKTPPYRTAIAGTSHGFSSVKMITSDDNKNPVSPKARAICRLKGNNRS